MKVTFEIEIEDKLVDNLDYYLNFGEKNDPKAGCNKCIFVGMCSYFTDQMREKISIEEIDCKFPCWSTRYDRITGTNRRVFVPKTEAY